MILSKNCKSITVIFTLYKLAQILMSVLEDYTHCGTIFEYKEIHQIKITFSVENEALKEENGGLKMVA